MTLDLSNWLPHILMLGSVVFVVAVVQLWLYLERRKTRRNPFTKDFLRSPGESLQAELDDVRGDIMENLFGILFIPVLLMAVYFGARLNGASNSSLSTFVFLGISVVIYSLYKLIRNLETNRKLRLGVEGERAVGEELNTLMLDGYRVFHDFPKKNGTKGMTPNIDHIVIGRNGVFAVETKARSKGKKGQGADAVKIRFNGESLIFPNGNITSAPLEQAGIHARWLSRWLQSAIGESIQVTPVVVYPGWWVDRVAPVRDVYLLAGGEITKSFKTLPGESLAPEKMRRVVHQIDQRCRNIKPWTAHNK